MLNILPPLKDEHIYKTKDRGSREGWIMHLGRPICSQRCRGLYSKKGLDKFECIRCNRPVYLSLFWPCTGRRNANVASRMKREESKHRQTALRSRRKLARTSCQREREIIYLSGLMHIQLATLCSINSLKREIRLAGFFWENPGNLSLGNCC